MRLVRRLAVSVVATLTVTIFAMQAFVLRPRLYPAGAGVTLSGDAILDELGAHPAVGFAHLPDVRGALGRSVTITAVQPDSPAARAGLREGALVTAIEDASGTRISIGDALPADAEAVMGLWGRTYRLSPVVDALTIEVSYLLCP